MTSPMDAADGSDRSVAEFFAELEDSRGPELSADEHRALVEAVRSDRERPDDD